MTTVWCTTLVKRGEDGTYYPRDIYREESEDAAREKVARDRERYGEFLTLSLAVARVEILDD